MDKTKQLIARIRQSKTISSSMWVSLQVVFTQLIRLGGNLILTRLLVPELFGIMAILYSISGFFHMISDIGLVPSIVNTKRENDPAFMETAWSIQFIRSLLLSLIIVIAAYPLSLAYSEPILFPLLLVLAFTNVLEGLNSTALILEQKHLRQKKLAITNLVIQLISMAIMLITAYLFHSIWALVAGNLTTCFCILLSSYKFFSPHNSKFRIEKEAANEIIHFGKWILLASLFGYFSSRAAPVIMGTVLTMDQLGIYMIAGTFATMVEIVANSLSAKVLQPRYRELIVNHTNFDALYKLRNYFNLAFLPSCIFLALTGEFIITTLYDDRYQSGGWILQILAVGRIGTILSNNARPILISLSDSKGLMVNQGYSAIITIGFMIGGGILAGFPGMVVANAISPIVQYVILGILLKKHGVYILFKDSLLIISCIFFILLGWFLLDSPPFKMALSLFSQTAIN